MGFMFQLEMVVRNYHSTQKHLHLPQVWYNWKQLYRFFHTVFITHMVFLNTEINDGRVLCVKAGSATKRFFFPHLLNSVLQMTLHSLCTVPPPQRSAHRQIHVE